VEEVEEAEAVEDAAEAVVVVDTVVAAVPMLVPVVLPRKGYVKP
jgi:hypothetical protein